jgi:hypothetical protein
MKITTYKKTILSQNLRAVIMDNLSTWTLESKTNIKLNKQTLEYIFSRIALKRLVNFENCPPTYIAPVPGLPSKLQPLQKICCFTAYTGKAYCVYIYGWDIFLLDLETYIGYAQSHLQRSSSTRFSHHKDELSHSDFLTFLDLNCFTVLKLSSPTELEMFLKIDCKTLYHKEKIFGFSFFDHLYKDNFVLSTNFNSNSFKIWDYESKITLEVKCREIILDDALYFYSEHFTTSNYIILGHASCIESYDLFNKCLYKAYSYTNGERKNSKKMFKVFNSKCFNTDLLIEVRSKYLIIYDFHTSDIFKKIHLEFSKRAISIWNEKYFFLATDDNLELWNLHEERVEKEIPVSCKNDLITQIDIFIHPVHGPTLFIDDDKIKMLSLNI